MSIADLPAGARDLFNGSDLASKVGATAQLIAVADDGWPRVALLSAGEVLVTDDTVMLTVYAASRTTGAARSSGRAVLLVVTDESIVRIALKLEELDAAQSLGGRTTFRGTVASVEQDRVAYARVTGGIGFELHDPEPVIERWEQQIELLRSAA